MVVEEEDGAAVTGGAAVTSNEPAPSRQCYSYILWMVEGKEKCRVREQIYIVVLALS